MNGFKIDHERGRNVLKTIDYAEVEGYYTKKWWLEKTFKDNEGREVQFRGWINTHALDERDFPDTLEGTFWLEACHDPNDRKIYGEACFSGCFDFGFGEDNNFVFGNVYPIYLEKGVNWNSQTRAGAENTLRANNAVDSMTWNRVEGKIEDCLVPSKTYIATNK